LNKLKSIICADQQLKPKNGGIHILPYDSMQFHSPNSALNKSKTQIALKASLLEACKHQILVEKAPCWMKEKNKL
jgi:hypothetical protein